VGLRSLYSLVPPYVRSNNGYSSRQRYGKRNRRFGYNGPMIDSAEPQRRWYLVTPEGLVIGLLIGECVLWLSERYQWFGFNHQKGLTVLLAVAAVGTAFVLMLFWFLASLVFRRRFQFGIRTLLLLSVAVALACSWLAAGLKKANAQREAAEAIVALQGRAEYLSENGLYPAPGGADPRVPAWLRATQLGDDFFYDIFTVVLSSDAQMELLKGLTNLRQVELEGGRVTDEGMAHVAGLTQLQELRFDHTGITDAGLRHIAGLIRLRHLWIYDSDKSKITDAGLAHVARLTQLRELSLYGTQITDAGMTRIEGLTQLERLVLSNTRITDAGLTNISSLARLSYLELGGTDFTDAGLSRLSGLTRLEVLNLNITRITDAGLPRLAGLTKLRELDLNDTQITDAGLASLASMSRLERLELYHTKITDAGLPSLAKLTQLHALKLANTQVTDEGVKKLKKLLPNCTITH
jgi:hypothetical protein